MLGLFVNEFANRKIKNDVNVFRMCIERGSLACDTHIKFNAIATVSDWKHQTGREKKAVLKNKTSQANRSIPF